MLFKEQLFVMELMARILQITFRKAGKKKKSKFHSEKGYKIVEFYGIEREQRFDSRWRDGERSSVLNI